MVSRINYIYNNNNLFIITVYVPCGSIYEHYGQNKKKNLAGMSHFLEHLLFKHTENFSGADILKEFTRIGGYYNASTDKDETMFYVKTLTENYKVATDLLYDIVVKPVFLKEDIVTEKKVVLEELAQSRDDFGDTLYNESTLTLISKNNIYYPPVIGKKSHLEAMGVDAIVDFYKRHYKNFMVVVNCDKRFLGGIADYVAMKFGQKMGMERKISFDDPRLLKLSQVYQSEGQRVRVESNETFQFNTSILFPSFKYSDVEKHVLLNFIKFCLTDAGLYSILSYEIREKRGLVYSIKMSNERMRYLGILRVTFGTSNKDIMGILNVILGILHELKTTGLSKAKLAYFKESYMNHMMYKFTNEEYRASWYGDNLFYGSSQNERDLFKSIKRISNSDIKNVCQEVFALDKVGIYTNGNYDNVRGATSQLVKDIVEKIDYWNKVKKEKIYSIMQS